MSIKKERISIPPNNEKLWKYLTEGLSGRTNDLPSYPKNITNENYIFFISERKKIQENEDV
tara:strand:+ start:1355 stop:1537 length:183 start_codon:yes stop_codon:yes gene_type:complete